MSKATEYGSYGSEAQKVAVEAFIARYAVDEDCLGMHDEWMTGGAIMTIAWGRGWKITRVFRPDGEELVPTWDDVGMPAQRP